VTLRQAVAMATATPAAFLGLGDVRGAIAAGFAVDGARHALTPPAAGELAAGLAVEGGRMLRGMTFRAVVTRAIVFCTGVMLLAYAGELLIASLMNAAGFR
jgi:hypothetical protein